MGDRTFTDDQLDEIDEYGGLLGRYRLTVDGEDAGEFRDVYSERVKLWRLAAWAVARGCRVRVRRTGGETVQTYQPWADSSKGA